MYLSIEACKKLKEWGCDADTDYSYNPIPVNGDECTVIYMIEKFLETTGEFKSFRAYNLKDIIYDGDMSKAFFGEGKVRATDINQIKGMEITQEEIDNSSLPIMSRVKYLTTKLKDYLLENKLKEAEDYFMEHTIFNPKEIKNNI